MLTADKTKDSGVKISGLRLEKLSDFLDEGFYIRTDREIPLKDLTEIIASKYERFAGLLSYDPENPPFSVDGSRSSIITLSGLDIEILQMGCSSPQSNQFLVRFIGGSERRKRDFYQYLRRNTGTNGDPVQRYLF